MDDDLRSVPDHGHLPVAPRDGADWIRTMHRARGLLGEKPQRMPEHANVVRPLVYESWRRSRLQGLDPGTVAPGVYADVDPETHLVRVVAGVVEKRLNALDDTACALTVTDQEGRMLRRWVTDRHFAAGLDRLAVAPGFSVAESHVGTTSAITLLNQAPVLVRGPEHFSENFQTVSCAGAPIVHPVSRRVVGSLDLTCRLEDTTPFVLTWVIEIVNHVHEALRDAASRRERLLLDSYLAHNRDARHPLVTLDRHTIINNAAAARLVSGADQALLWEHASREMRDGEGALRSLTLADGHRVAVETRPVRDGAEVVGAVLLLRPDAERVGGGRSTALRATALPGLVGSSPRWRRLCGQVAQRGDADRVLVVGEPGSGRLSVARAIAPVGPLRVVDAADAGTATSVEDWAHAVESEIDGPEEVLVLRHVDQLDPGLARTTERAVRRRPSARPVLATSEVGPTVDAVGGPLLDTFPDVLEVPALRDRIEDLPALLAELTRRAAGEAAEVSWMPDAVQALSRLDWPGNVAALEVLVRRLVPRCRGRAYIGASDLPADLAARAARRPLAMLEQVEARTIMQALREADGNKFRAAESLGIARSTLYRKVKALGLDLSSVTF